MKKIIFATGNEGKMKEIRMILSDIDAQILSMKEAGIFADIVEDGTTFEENAKIKAKTLTPQNYTKESIFKFMEFDGIEDNMILQKGGKRFLMVIECQGVNYDLMSGLEKNSVEQGFLQFLNTLRYPIQIYVQTRTVNLGASINTYKERVDDISKQYASKQMEYNQKVRSGQFTDEELSKEKYELIRQRNLYEYGVDIINNTERMSLNKNILSKHYYVIIPYYPEEASSGAYQQDEITSLAFSELYTRAQSTVRTLSVCGINAKVMNSNELVELLYVAYNRDEAEVYGLDKALKAGYDELYSTAPDVVDKQIKALDEQIEEEALELAKQKVYEARTEKQKMLQEKREKKRDLISEIADLIIAENSSVIGEDIAESAKSKIKQEKTKEEGGKDNGKEKSKRVRKTKTA